VDRHRDPGDITSPSAPIESVAAHPYAPQLLHQDITVDDCSRRSLFELCREAGHEFLIAERRQEHEPSRRRVRQIAITDARMNTNGLRAFDKLDANSLRTVEHSDVGAF
jgi:hypothetical protein